MGTKDKLLEMLESSQNDFVSGEEAGKLLGVSRAAVWKAAKGLQEEGVQIESLQGSGYRIVPGADWLDRRRILNFADGEYPVQVFDEIDSTNTACKCWAAQGAPHGAWVIANEQTAGRGRFERKYESPKGGLYFSVILRPKPSDTATHLITAAAGVAICQSVSVLCGIELSIKWVNDLFIQNKKCCGILTEAGMSLENGCIDYLVVGIGLNYTTSVKDFASARQVAGSLFPGGVAPVPRAQLAADIHRRLLEKAESLNKRSFLREYRSRSLVLGSMVTVNDKCPYTAKAVEIDDEARLVVEKPDGQRVVLSSGEVSIKPEGQHIG